MFFADAPADEPPITLMPKDRNKCALIADIICLQCILVGIGATSILACTWTPEHSTDDYAKLTRIMYLYDSQACGYKLQKAKQIANLQLSNETYGLDILPIKWLPAMTSVSTRLSAKTRNYITLSFTFHVLWFILAITFRVIIKNSSDLRTLKGALAIFLYSCAFIICFDLSMAVLYVTHIKQSLDKGMILRYSGWGTDLKLNTYDDFAGWLPIVAAACWLRGVVIFMMNVYFCRVMRSIRRKIKSRELRKKKLYNELYQRFPESEQVQLADTNVLVYRVGEREPQVKQVVFDFFIKR